MPPQNKPFNLFVYGTLMNPSVFRAVLGLDLVSRSQDADGIQYFCPKEAVLGGYKKTSPDRTYLYAVPDPLGRINGYLIGPLAGEPRIRNKIQRQLHDPSRAHFVDHAVDRRLRPAELLHQLVDVRAAFKRLVNARFLRFGQRAREVWKNRQLRVLLVELADRGTNGLDASASALRQSARNLRLPAAGGRQSTCAIDDVAALLV